MNLPDKHIHHLIDGLTENAPGFALYRLPWTDECHLVLQQHGEVETLESIRQLNGKRGFVIAPFRITEAHPLVLIRPDVTASGWDAIGKAMSSWEESGYLRLVKCLFTPRKMPISENPPQKALEAYREVFNRFIIPLREKSFRKLVLSRTESCPLAEDFSPLEAFVKACNAYPRMMIYLCHTPASGTWIGSTPEILLSGCGEAWHTVALAGTMPMQGEVMPEEWSTKNREEQALVADYIRDIVQRYGGEISEEGPYTARAGQLVHLKSDFHFRLKDTASLGDLLEEMHPTPAVCGLPKAETYRFIPENEAHDRRYYSGFIGWLAPDGQTDVYVNLRCMEILQGAARLYAGGGILASSDVASEFEETKEKLKTMKNII